MQKINKYLKDYLENLRKCIFSKTFFVICVQEYLENKEYNIGRHNAGFAGGGPDATEFFQTLSKFSSCPLPFSQHRRVGPLRHQPIILYSDYLAVRARKNQSFYSK